MQPKSPVRIDAEPIPTVQFVLPSCDIFGKTGLILKGEFHAGWILRTELHDHLHQRRKWLHPCGGKAETIPDGFNHGLSHGKTTLIFLIYTRPDPSPVVSIAENKSFSMKSLSNR